jgi:DNA-directed RNA polymerase subunit beta
VLESGLPESFNVLVKELQSLGLNLELVEGGSNDDVYVPDDTNADEIGDAQ